MTLQRQMMFWLGALALGVLFVWLFRGILLPFVLGMALAYLLDPIADRLEARGMSRMMATTVVFLCLSVIFIFALLLVVPPVARQIIELFASLKGYIPGTLKTFFGFTDADMASFAQLLNGDVTLSASGLFDLTAIRSFIENNAGIIANIGGRVMDQGAAALDIISLMVVTPVVAFYLLYDWDHLVAKVRALLPRDHAPLIEHLTSEINTALAGFVRGQVMLGLILGTFYAISLTLVGLKFGLVIGLGAGIVSFIPYVGALSGLLASVGVAAVQFWHDPVWIGVVALIFAVGQFFEGNILQPKLVGESVGLHPVALLFAIMAFGSLFGFLGMLLAVPLAAAIAVLVRYALERYKGSILYYGLNGNGDGVERDEQA